MESPVPFWDGLLIRFTLIGLPADKDRYEDQQQQATVDATMQTGTPQASKQLTPAPAEEDARHE